MKRKIQQDLFNLQKANEHKNSVKVSNKSLKNCLLNEKLATEQGDFLKLKITCVKIVDIEVKKKNILKLAVELLPAITGHMILSTSRGIMSHHRAMKEGLGGKVIAVIY